MNPTVRLSVLVLCLIAIGAIEFARLFLGGWSPAVFWDFAAVETPPPALGSGGPGSHLIAVTIPIQRGDTLGDLLGNFGVDEQTKAGLIAAIRDAFDIRKIRAGSQLTIGRTAWGSVESLEYAIDPDRKLALAKSEGEFVAEIVESPSTIRPVRVCGTIRSSLFESIERTGERSELASQLADVFAWSLDFYTDPREGDEYCLVVEKKEYAGARPAAYQRILAARYDNAGRVHDAYLFAEEDGAPRYYSRDGESLQSSFLRSPLRFEARVISRFSGRRLHPVLGTYRAHPGNDYAAPVGTSVQAVGSGRVIFSGRSGDAGNMIRIAHPGGFETQYLHLSRRLVQHGERIEQGQRIGLVGQTGLATGPHLDFRIQKNGRYLDFERIQLPRASKIGEDQKLAFAAVRDRFLGLLELNSPRATAMLAGSALPAARPSHP